MYTGPSLRSLAVSLAIHACAVAGLFSISPAPEPPEEPSARTQPTEIRIGGKLYYFSELAGSSANRSQDRAPGKLAAPRAANAGKGRRPRPNPAPGPADAPAPPPDQVAKAPAPAPQPETPPQTPPEPAPKPRVQARAFIPPQVKPNPAASQTLIQPLSPPDLVPPPTPLPNFRVITDMSQFKRIPRRFVAPGRKTPATPTQTTEIAQPAITLTPQPPAPPGDPVNIFALSNRPAPLTDRVVVPPGNIAQPSGDSTAGGANGAVNGAPSASTGASASNAASNTAAAGGSPNGTPGKTGSPGGVAVAGNSNGTGNAAGNAGNGRSTVGNGSGAALAGASKDGSLTAVVGGTGVNGAAAQPGGNGSAPNAAGTGTGGPAGPPGSGAGAGASVVTTPGTVIINRPGGTFDTVVVQTTPLDQYPESRNLLTGRPIYSVYLSAGTARDWTMFYCVPGEKPEGGTGPIVKLGAPAPAIKAPYPTKLVRPLIKLPSYEKYVLVHGFVNKEGKFEGLKIVRSVRPEIDQALLASLGQWVFRAATRDGVDIAVEFLLSIPAKGL